MNKQELINHIKDQNEWSGNHRFILIKKEELISMIEDLDQPQKVKVPAFVAEWIEWCKSHRRTLANVMLVENIKYYESHNEPSGLLDWYITKGNDAVLARAWLDGYEVEDEPKYRVEFPVGYGYRYLSKDSSGQTVFTCALGKYISEFTEAEIKSIDERYWPFAVPVEKV